MASDSARSISSRIGAWSWHLLYCSTEAGLRWYAVMGHGWYAGVRAAGAMRLAMRLTVYHCGSVGHHARGNVYFLEARCTLGGSPKATLTTTHVHAPPPHPPHPLPHIPPHSPPHSPPHLLQLYLHPPHSRLYLFHLHICFTFLFQHFLNAILLDARNLNCGP